MRFALTVTVILLSVAFAYRYGRGPERSAAAILSTAFVVSLIARLLRGPIEYVHLDPIAAAVDTATLGGVMWVALNANRVWPLVIASLQLFVIIAHVSVLLSSGWNQVYWGMMAIAQYLQLIVLVIGIASHHSRERRIGRYRSWRPSHDTGGGSRRPLAGSHAIPKPRMFTLLWPHASRSSSRRDGKRPQPRAMLRAKS